MTSCTNCIELQSLQHYTAYMRWMLYGLMDGSLPIVSRRLNNGSSVGFSLKELGGDVLGVTVREHFPESD